MHTYIQAYRQTDMHTHIPYLHTTHIHAYTHTYTHLVQLYEVNDDGNNDNGQIKELQRQSQNSPTETVHAHEHLEQIDVKNAAS